MKELKRILPDFPRIPHLSFKPNVVEGDIVCNDNIIGKEVFIEEKIDGASCGMCLYEGNAIIRNKNHILRKGYKKDTPAKLQFLPAWGWFYDKKKRFELLGDYSVYGEWAYALHGVKYDKLPDLFIAYDLYDYHVGKFIETAAARLRLIDAGFSVPPLLYSGKIESWEQLEAMCNEPSGFSTTDKREGIVVKCNAGKYLTARYKMVRQGFVQGCNWDVRKITRNVIVND